MVAQSALRGNTRLNRYRLITKISARPTRIVFQGISSPAPLPNMLPPNDDKAKVLLVVRARERDGVSRGPTARVARERPGSLLSIVVSMTRRRTRTSASSLCELRNWGLTERRKPAIVMMTARVNNMTSTKVIDTLLLDYLVTKDSKRENTWLVRTTFLQLLETSISQYLRQFNSNNARFLPQFEPYLTLDKAYPLTIETPKSTAHRKRWGSKLAPPQIMTSHDQPPFRCHPERSEG